MKKNYMGIYVLDNLEKLPKDIVGRKQKIWLKDGKKEYLFKTGASNYEIFAELISSELARQCNMETAEYDIATYNGYIGVFTPNFLIEDDVILSGEDLYKCAKILSPNSKFSNSIDSIYEMLKVLTSRDYDIENLKKQLLKIWLFDGLICEGDRNFSNWSIIINKNDIRLAPIYDCSTMCMLNNDVHRLINTVKNENDIDFLINSIKFQLKRKQTDSDAGFLEAFYELCSEEPLLVEAFINEIHNIDVEKAIENIENRINLNSKMNFKIPWECSFWINKILKRRIQDLFCIYIQSMIEKQQKHTIEKKIKI